MTIIHKQSGAKLSDIKAVITDMDGSFLGRSGQVSPVNIRAVRKLQSAGIRFLVCTGRTREEAIQPLKKAGISCDMICMNGAAIYQQNHIPVRELALEKNQVAEVLNAAAREEILIHMITDCREFIIGDEKRFRDFFCTYMFPYMGIKADHQEAALKTYQQTTVSEFLKLDSKCYKIVTLCSDLAPLQEIAPALGAIKGISAAASYATNWEITNEQATKGLALKEYAALCGLGLFQIMAFGDGENDVSMLELPLGLSVAMENAVPAAKAAADYVTGTNEEDGFASAVNYLWEA